MREGFVGIRERIRAGTRPESGPSISPVGGAGTPARDPHHRPDVGTVVHLSRRRLDDPVVRGVGGGAAAPTGTTRREDPDDVTPTGSPAAGAVDATSPGMTTAPSPPALDAGERAGSPLPRWGRRPPGRPTSRRGIRREAAVGYLLAPLIETASVALWPVSVADDGRSSCRAWNRRPTARCRPPSSSGDRSPTGRSSRPAGAVAASSRALPVRGSREKGPRSRCRDPPALRSVVHRRLR